MTSTMMQEIVDDWREWRYDIIELNTATWSQRDEEKINAITAILEEQLESQKAMDKNDWEANNKTNAQQRFLCRV